ncbi:unnamed protein product [Phytophthora lilii]|uniref:Unnamed protein product n=1 Tax=Phytophthora lilii TaxID=2077276 RepID=A0A9W6X6X5_9STRA|nr:unnamed protein product [Phytophthora lilii]
MQISASANSATTLSRAGLLPRKCCTANVDQQFVNNRAINMSSATHEAASDSIGTPDTFALIIPPLLASEYCKKMFAFNPKQTGSRKDHSPAVHCGRNYHSKSLLTVLSQPCFNGWS